MEFELRRFGERRVVAFPGSLSLPGRNECRRLPRVVGAIRGAVAAGQAFAGPRVALAPGAFDGQNPDDFIIGSAAMS